MWELGYVIECAVFISVGSLLSVSDFMFRSLVGGLVPEDLSFEEMEVYLICKVFV